MALNHKELLDQLARTKAMRESADIAPKRAGDYAPLALDTDARGTSPVLKAVQDRVGANSDRELQFESTMAQNERNFQQYMEAQQQLQRAQESLKQAEKLKALQSRYNGPSTVNFGGGPRGGAGSTSQAPQNIVDAINRGQNPRGNFQVPTNKSGQVFWYSPPGSTRHQHTSGYDFAKWSGDINIPGRGDLGRPVPAFKPGIVETVNRWNHSYGHHIIVRHADGTRTLYAHLSGINVKPGQKVGGGQLIGKVGSTGKSSGPHLHFEIR